MKGIIDDRNPTYLLREIEANTDIKLNGKESLKLLEDVIRPFLQKQFDEGVEFAKRKFKETFDSIKKN